MKIVAMTNRGPPGVREVSQKVNEPVSEKPGTVANVFASFVCFYAQFNRSDPIRPLKEKVSQRVNESVGQWLNRPVGMHAAVRSAKSVQSADFPCLCLLRSLFVQPIPTESDLNSKR
jgi:hypothetical protein